VLAELGALASSPEEMDEALERQAGLLARLGDLAAARATLERGLDAVAPGSPGALMLRARLGRLLVTAGEHRQALATVAPLLGEPAEQTGTLGGWLAHGRGTAASLPWTARDLGPPATTPLGKAQLRQRG
jgi:hypothetical protein